MFVSGLVKEPKQDSKDSNKQHKTSACANTIVKIGLSNKKRKITDTKETFLENNFQQNDI